MGRRLPGLLVLLALAAAAHGKERWNVDFRLGWGGCYRPMQWTPVQIGITGTGFSKAFAARVTLTTQQDGLNNMIVTALRVLSPAQRVNLPMSVKLTYPAPDSTVRIIDERGRVRWSNDLGVFGSAGRPRLTPVSNEELLIGFVGRRASGLPALETNALAGGSGDALIYARQKFPEQLPWDWTGYASLDLLVLDDVDWAGSINDHQARAIAKWVSNGGKLLLVMGGNPLAPKNPLAKALPLRFGTPNQITLSRGALSRMGLPDGREAKVLSWPMAKAPPAAWRIGSQDGAAVFAQGSVAFGEVRVVPFNPMGLVSKPRAAVPFWVRQAQELLGSERISHRPGGVDRSEYDQSDDHSYELGLAAKGSNCVLEHLFRIPELRPLSIWWVVGLLVALALVVGPVDYVVLKKLDRQPLTWVTSACVIALFTVGAYYGVQYIRGGAMQVRAVTVTDAVQGSPAAWTTTYSGIFAPGSDEYHLTGLRPRQWWSGISPTEQTELYGYSHEVGSRNIYYQQGDGGNLPSAVPINIWSMQCLLGEYPSAGAPFSAKVDLAGGRVAIEIENNSETAIRGGYVRMKDNRTMRFGPVAAKASRRFDGPLQGAGHWRECVESSYPGRFVTDAAFFAQGCLRRTRAIQGYLSAGAAVVCVEYDRAPLEFGVANRRGDQDHVKLARLVVFPGKD